MSDKIVTADEVSGSGKKPRQVKMAERVFVDSSVAPESIVEWDAEGKQIFFTEDTNEIPAEFLDKLSKVTVLKYRQALEIKTRLAGVDPAWDEINKAIKISQGGYASPRDIAFGNKAKGGLRAKLVREDRLGYWSSKGYVMAKPEHMVDAKMRQVEGHYEHGTVGAPREFLMVTTDENRQRLMDERDANRNRLDELQVEDGKRKARDAGLPAFDAS